MRSNLLLILLPLACLCGPAQAERPALISPSSVVAGASQEEWSRRWWQWALSFEHDESPVADRTGAFCTLGQQGQVWFLAGAYGTRRTERTCRVPQGQTLFFPLINYVTFPPDDRKANCMSLMSDAARLTHDPSALILEVDGIRFDALAAHRQATKGCFKLQAGGARNAAANGYYVALAPLAPGVHILNFGGILPTMSQAVTYRLIVE